MSIFESWIKKRKADLIDEIGVENVVNQYGAEAVPVKYEVERIYGGYNLLFGFVHNDVFIGSVTIKEDKLPDENNWLTIRLAILEEHTRYIGQNMSLVFPSILNFLKEKNFDLVFVKPQKFQREFKKRGIKPVRDDYYRVADFQ